MRVYPPERTRVRSVRAGLSCKIVYTVYVLKDKNDNLYKGMTNNLVRRLQEHRSGQTKTTSRMNEINVVYSEEYQKFSEARERELYLKSAAGRRFLKLKLLG